MSSRDPATVTFSLNILAEHGGKSAPHKGGWGIAYYEDTDIRRLRDTTCASGSPWVQFAEEQELRSSLVLSHIRKATEGAIAIKNTQPFIRELGGRVHVFAHNGHLPGIREHGKFRVASFHPVGEYKPPGLHLLRRQRAKRDAYAETAGVSVQSPSQEVILVASVPLTAEAWEPLRGGELVMISRGEVIRRELR